MKRVTIVIPTYNERENVSRLLKAIHRQRLRLKNVRLSVLVVDDCSPDGTANEVKRLRKQYPDIHLLTGKKQGLGIAYKRGFKYAVEKLKADVVFEMDADFSHDPNDIPRFFNKILEGSDFVIGSRYVPGSSIPNSWSWLRKANSRWGNIFARYVAGLKRVRDCTSGYRAIKSNVIRNINLDTLRASGYAFQMSLLHEAIKNNSNISEIPIKFTDRVRGKSKIRTADIVEFIIISLRIRLSFLKPSPKQLFTLSGGLFLIILSGFIFAGIFSHRTLLLGFILGLSTIMTLQGLFTLFWMLYAWEDPTRAEQDKSPKKYYKPRYSFTALVPARHEELVIGDTLKSISSIDYPKDLKETLVICRSDDQGTIKAVKKTISEINKNNIKLVVFDSLPINKPRGLNIGLQHATKNVIVVFDAEDEPHKDIYNVVNTVILKDKVDVVQSGVQLMNFRSHWFSTLNVLEYFFWFKSSLHFFARAGFIPLGGNTVFFKKKWLKKIGGWEDNCLTEDADVGIRLSAAGARMRVVYDEQHTTQEETPLNMMSFIRQRTRWNQGFMQILFKGDWLGLPKLSQRILAAYILIWSEIQSLMFLYIPFSIVMMITLKIPVAIAMFSALPLYILILQLVANNIGLYEFTKDYNLRFPLWMPLKIFLTFYPFQILLGFSAFRAVYRLLKRNGAWEKTQHINAHRKVYHLTPSILPLTNTEPLKEKAYEENRPNIYN